MLKLFLFCSGCPHDVLAIRVAFSIFFRTVYPFSISHSSLHLQRTRPLARWVLQLVLQLGALPVLLAFISYDAYVVFSANYGDIITANFWG